MTEEINLLPWRQINRAKRRQRNRMYCLFCIVLISGGVLLVQQQWHKNWLAQKAINQKLQTRLVGLRKQLQQHKLQVTTSRKAQKTTANDSPLEKVTNYPTAHQHSNAIYISRAKDMLQNLKLEKQMQQQLAQLEPLIIKIMPIHYADASNIAHLLTTENKRLLITPGSIAVDRRSNSLLLRVPQKNLVKISQVIKQLDRPIKQVLIKLRIVDIDRSYSRELGIKFTSSLQEHQNTQNAASGLQLDLPSQAALNSGFSGTKQSVVRLALVPKGYLLDLELAAMESEGVGKVIATPRLLTADRHAAVIEAGEEIPFQQATSSGATAVTFKKAVVKLQVTPQVMPSGKILLDLGVNQDKRGQAIANVPAIDTQMLKTQIILSSGQTMVLGGIYQQINHQQITKIPGLSSLPLLGKWFRYRKKSARRMELLIFVCAKIVDTKSIVS